MPATAPAPAPAPALLRVPDLTEMLGVSRKTIWAWRRAGTFPEPIRLGDRLIAWRPEDIDDWLEAQTAAVE